MFDDIPDLYKRQTADNEGEGWRYVPGDKEARRPPELLTRDHVARYIVKQIKAGKGSPHGGVFLDIAWIKERLPNAEEHIKRKLAGMYHQFKQLAGIDITKEPMEVGPTTHYMMGGIEVDGDTQMSSVPGLFAAQVCTAQTGWAATRSRICWCSASGPGSTGTSRSTGTKSELIPQALAKAERYRLLNEPAESESICGDILAADPGNQRALVWLLLSIADQMAFGRHGGRSARP